MKYRRLDLADLKSLEKDFVRFLASNHITAADWVQLKKENTEKVDQLVDMYSDIVWEKTLPTVRYLEFIGAHDCKVFFCDDTQIHLIGLTIDKSVDIDFQNINLLTDLPELLAQHKDQIHLYHSEKDYQKEREAEIFDLLEGGCLISKEGHLYQLLTALRK